MIGALCQSIGSSIRPMDYFLFWFFQLLYKGGSPPLHLTPLSKALRFYGVYLSIFSLSLSRNTFISLKVAILLFEWNLAREEDFLSGCVVCLIIESVIILRRLSHPSDWRIKPVIKSLFWFNKLCWKISAFGYWDQLENL